jgi:type VI protein secretion system component Hcp
VTITKIQSAGVSSTDPGMPMEEVSFSYSKITWEYRSSSGVVSAGWDLAQNKSVG